MPSSRADTDAVPFLREVVASRSSPCHITTRRTSVMDACRAARGTGKAGALRQTSGTWLGRKAMNRPTYLLAVATALGAFWLLTDSVSAQQTPRYPLDDKLANEIGRASC